MGLQKSEWVSLFVPVWARSPLRSRFFPIPIQARTGEKICVSNDSIPSHLVHVSVKVFCDDFLLNAGPFARIIEEALLHTEVRMFLHQRPVFER
jgi:hypothetical protein